MKYTLKGCWSLFFLICLIFNVSCRHSAPQETPPPKTPPAGSLQNLVDAEKLVPSLEVKMMYATSDNFLKQPVYLNLHSDLTNPQGDDKPTTSLTKCLLQKEVGEQLAKANRHLQEYYPDLHFLAYDCARPRSVQLVMWELVKDTPQQPYVANPYDGISSVHNYGCAIDLTLADEDGVPLDMGTPFDYFGAEAEPQKEALMLKEGKLTPEQVSNRLILRNAMEHAGFKVLENEWWHFNCLPPALVPYRYAIIP